MLRTINSHICMFKASIIKSYLPQRIPTKSLYASKTLKAVSMIY